MNIESLESYFAEHNLPRYEREGFDRFVKKTKLNLNVPSIHITGSNGKGATVDYLAKIYHAAGYKVAAFTSPYFYSVNEMIKVDGKAISDEDLISVFNEGQKLFEKFDLSSFEIQVYIAYTYFNRVKPDIAIIECGMGGATDATNIIAPILSIITSVSLEHTAYLGRSVSEIAASKGGIVKEGVPLLVGKVDDGATFALKQICEYNDSPYLIVDDIHFPTIDESGYTFDYRPYKGLRINSKAAYQMNNAAMAIEAVKILESRFLVSEENIKSALLEPAPILHEERIDRFVFDGAHNPEAVKSLMRDFSVFSEGRKVHVVFASFRDKNIAVEFPLIANYAADMTLTTFDHPRARDQMDYFLYEEDFHFEEDYKKAIRDAYEKDPEGIVLVTGSLAFAAIARKFVLEEMLK